MFVQAKRIDMSSICLVGIGSKTSGAKFAEMLELPPELKIFTDVRQTWDWSWRSYTWWWYIWIKPSIMMYISCCLNFTSSTYLILFVCERIWANVFGWGSKTCLDVGRNGWFKEKDMPQHTSVVIRQWYYHVLPKPHDKCNHIELILHCFGLCLRVHVFELCLISADWSQSARLRPDSIYILVQWRELSLLLFRVRYEGRSFGCWHK